MPVSISLPEHDTIPWEIVGSEIAAVAAAVVAIRSIRRHRKNADESNDPDGYINLIPN